MLEAVIALARGARLEPIIAVVPPGLAVPADVVPVVNDAPMEGLSRSLRLGIAAVPVECDAALVLLGDQPTLELGVIEAVLAAGGSGPPVVAVRAAGHLAPPVLLTRAAFGLVDEAVGDTGLGPVLAERPDLVTVVEIRAHAPGVDTPLDLERIR